MKGWYRLDLVRLLVLAVPAFLAYALLVESAPPADRPVWMLALALVLAAAGLLLLGAIELDGPRSLGAGYLAFFFVFVFLFALAADMDLLAGPRQVLRGYGQTVPRNLLGLGGLGDWHYWLAPEPPPALQLLVVTLPSFEGKSREIVRRQLAILIRQASLHQARGVALDFYLEAESRFDGKLREEIETASAGGTPVVFGRRLVENPDGLLIRSPMAREIEEVAEHWGHLQAYREGDGRVRLIPTLVPGAGEERALSVVVAELLAPEPLPGAAKRLLRFLPPENGVTTLPVEDLDWSSVRDRFVFVGSRSENDRALTPFGTVQGVELHAWAAHTLLTHSALTRVDPRAGLPLIFVLCYCLTVLHARGFPVRHQVLAALALSALVVALAVAGLRGFRLWVEVGYPLLAIWLMTAFHGITSAVRRRRAGRRQARSQSQAGSHSQAGSQSSGSPTPEDRPAAAVERRPPAAGRAAGRAEDRPGFDVFVSHNSTDKQTVRELCRELQRLGLSPWLDEEQLTPGRPWQEALEQAIRSAPAVAVLVGSEGIGPWETVEMRASLSEAVRRGVPVIPVLLPGASAKPVLPLFLTAFTWVDLRDGLSPHGLERLLWGITGEKPA